MCGVEERRKGEEKGELRGEGGGGGRGEGRGCWRGEGGGGVSGGGRGGEGEGEGEEPLQQSVGASEAPLFSCPGRVMPCAAVEHKRQLDITAVPPQ